MMDEEKDLSSASLADEFADKDLQGLAGVIREMREASGLDKEANTREPVRHFKRLGRELAMQFLYQCEIAGSEDFVENLDNFWCQAELSGKFVEGRVFRKGRAYAEKLIAGVLEKMEHINSLLEKYSRQWDISRMPVVDKNIMRVAIYELENCPDIPAVVSIDEAIEISKEFGSERSGLFINGILNSVKGELPPGTKNPPPQKTAKTGRYGISAGKKSYGEKK